MEISETNGLRICFIEKVLEEILKVFFATNIPFSLNLFSIKNVSFPFDAT